MFLGTFLLAAGLASQSVALDCTNSTTPTAQAPASSEDGFEVRSLPPAPSPYELVGGLIVVRICIGGHQAWAMLDNRAASLIDKEFARSLGLEISGPHGAGQTPGGEFLLYRASKVAIRVPGNFEFNTPMRATDLGPISELMGRDISFIVGQEFFEYMALYVNPKVGTFLFRPSGDFTPGRNAKDRLVSILLSGQDSQVPVTIDDVTFQLTVDLGYNGDLTLKPEAWSKLGWSDSNASYYGSASLSGNITPTRSVQVSELRLGELKRSQVRVSISPLAGVSGDGFVGTGLLTRSSFVLDTKAGKLMIFMNE